MDVHNFSLEATAAAPSVYCGCGKLTAPDIRPSASSSGCASVLRWPTTIMRTTHLVGTRCVGFILAALLPMAIFSSSGAATNTAVADGSSAEEPISTPPFLFLTSGTYRCPEYPHLAVGKIEHGELFQYHLLKQIGGTILPWDDRLVVKLDGNELWLNGPFDTLICFDQREVEVAALISNASKVLAVTPTEILFEVYRTPSGRGTHEPHIRAVDLVTHEIRRVSPPESLGNFVLVRRGSVTMSPDGRMVTMAKPHPTKGYDLFVQRVETTNVTKLGSFPGLPRDPRSSNWDDDNLLWLGTNRLVVACGTDDTRQPYRVELYEVGAGRRISALPLPPQELGLCVRLWTAKDGGFWFEAQERYLIDDDLTSARPAASIKRDFLLTHPNGTRTLINNRQRLCTHPTRIVTSLK